MLEPPISRILGVILAPPVHPVQRVEEGSSAYSDLITFKQISSIFTHTTQQILCAPSKKRKKPSILKATDVLNHICNNIFDILNNNGLPSPQSPETAAFL